MAKSRPFSLAARLALISAVWSAGTLLVMGLILTGLFRSDAERKFDARIEADLVNLVRDAVSQPVGEPALPVEPLGPLFREPFSGWAWQVRRGNQIVAQSDSLGPMIEGVMEPLQAPGVAPADFVAPGDILSRGAARPILLTGNSGPLIFAVSRPREEVDASVAYFSTLLRYSLALFGTVMFGASMLLVRIILAPVKRLEAAVRRLRDGETAPLDSLWPREILPVIDELKGLSTHIDRLVERSRNQSSDLAHALKTPLSIMRQETERAPAEIAKPLIVQLGRIENSLDWHLTRRRLAGPRYGQVNVRDVADDIMFAMSRLFDGRELNLTSQVGIDACFVGDEEDLHEMLGNLIENACKWAAGTVIVAATVSGNELQIQVEDDGPGIPDDIAETVFLRGARLDENAPGHGHGLAIVRDIADLYGGKVDIRAASIGGASIHLTVPGAVASVSS